jgi:Anti-sigma-K factor rskA
VIGPKIEDRMIELLADRATGALSNEDERELAELLRRYPELDTDVLDLAAAAVHLAYEEAPLAPLPAHVAARVEAALLRDGAKTVVDPSHLPTLPIAAPARPAEARAPDAPARTPSAPPSLVARASAREAAPARVSWLAYAGWAAAAVFFLVSAALFRASHEAPVPLANQRARLMAQPGTVQSAFVALKDESAAQAQGDVVWSTREQRGFMRFRGLASNPHDKWVYQLWIFDTEQDERFPIDGGVFDIDPSNAAGTDVLVPIQAKINVAKPTQFVVTIEKPGGVVVSKRERVALLAKLGS